MFHRYCYISLKAIVINVILIEFLVGREVPLEKL